MKKNVGELDAYLRLTCGYTMLGYGIMRKSIFPIFIGSMKIAEGLTRWCPMLAIMNVSTTSECRTEDMISEIEENGV